MKLKELILISAILLSSSVSLGKEGKLTKKRAPASVETACSAELRGQAAKQVARLKNCFLVSDLFTTAPGVVTLSVDPAKGVTLSAFTVSGAESSPQLGRQPVAVKSGLGNQILKFKANDALVEFKSIDFDGDGQSEVVVRTLGFQNAMLFVLRVQGSGFERVDFIRPDLKKRKGFVMNDANRFVNLKSGRISVPIAKVAGSAESFFQTEEFVSYRFSREARAFVKE